MARGMTWSTEAFLTPREKAGRGRVDPAVATPACQVWRRRAEVTAFVPPIKTSGPWPAGEDLVLGRRLSSGRGSADHGAE